MSLILAIVLRTKRGKSATVGYTVNRDLRIQTHGNGLHFVSGSGRMIPELRRNRH